MRFLADESCDFAVVRALRTEGHDVLAICEHSPGVPDEQVADLARSEDRVLLTEDKDFGQLFQARLAPSPGVVLIRWPARLRAALASSVCALVAQHGDRLPGSFTVLQPGRIRIQPRS